MKNNNVKILEREASKELKNYYARELKVYYNDGLFDKDKNKNSKLIVFDETTKEFWTNKNCVTFLDNCKRLESLSSFSKIFDMYKIDEAKERLREVEEDFDYEIYTKAVISLEYGINDIDQINQSYQLLIENDANRILDQSYKREIEKHHNLTKFIDIDNDGTDDRIDIDNRNSNLRTIKDYSDIDMER